MIKLTLERTAQGDIFSCLIEGHAQAGEKGQDIVCAAVSALSETALLGLLQYVQAKVDYKVQAGLLQFKLQEIPSEKTNAILETMLLGLQEIAKAYPANLKLSVVGGESHV